MSRRESNEPFSWLVPGMPLPQGLTKSAMRDPPRLAGSTHHQCQPSLTVGMLMLMPCVHGTLSAGMWMSSKNACAQGAQENSHPILPNPYLLVRLEQPTACLQLAAGQIMPAHEQYKSSPGWHHNVPCKSKHKGTSMQASKKLQNTSLKAD